MQVRSLHIGCFSKQWYLSTNEARACHIES
jgi:hypothetical protein